MKTTRNDTDRLTKALLDGCREKASEGFELRILERIQKEAPLKRPYALSTPRPFGGLLLLGLGYLLLVVCLVALLWNYNADPGNFYYHFKEAFPYFLSLLAIGSSFAMYLALDKVLFHTK